MKFLWTFEGGDRKPRKRNFDIKIAEGDVLSLTYFSIDEVGLNSVTVTISGLNDAGHDQKKQKKQHCPNQVSTKNWTTSWGYATV